MARFPGVDYLLIDSLFSEQELLVRANRAAVRRRARASADPRLLSRRALPEGADPRNGDAWDSWARISKATAAPA